MSKKLTVEELQKKINECVAELNSFLTNLNKNEEEHKKSMLLIYWIFDYIKMLRSEKSFNPNTLLKYNKGDVVSINFGFRIGSELGGRHFAIVLDNFNSKNSSTLTVVPLTSMKKDYKDNIFSHVLKKGLYELHNEKFEKRFDKCKEEIKNITQDFLKVQDMTDEEYNDFFKKIDKTQKSIEEAKVLQDKLQDLKEGSVVSLGQIVTISKIRLLNPKSTHDSLYKIKISKEDMEIINEKIKYLYLKN